MRIIIFTLLLLGFVSCKTSNKTNVDVSKISIDVKVARFDVDFYNSSEEKLPEIKKKYPMLFPHDIDSVWVNKINNKDEQELFVETQKKYKDFSFEEKKLEKLFKHIKYYHPNFEEPIVITMLTNMESRAVYADDFLFISLDNYLGKQHNFYADYPPYIRQTNTKEHLIVDVAKAFINSQIPPNRNRRFLDKMIFEGKKMYLLDMYLPEVSDHLKIGYSQKKMAWAQVNEESVWRYFIDKNLLYSTDTKLNKRFLDLAPFSKFYMEDDSDSPGQIGKYMGWQIVRAFMQNNDVSLQQLVQIKEEELFKKSKFKPKR